LFDTVEVGVDGEGFFVRFNCLAGLVEVGVAMPQACPRPEMTGHQAYGVMTIDQGFFKPFLEVIRNRPLVVSFGEVG
jgi:hypothetical protein